MPFTMPAPKDSVEGISDAECSSLKNNTGIDATEGIDNCEAIAEQILPLIEQELDSISHGVKTIFANEDSKCKAGDENPTLASILSRIYRATGALACNICSYDPELVTRLKSGRANQVLWGQGLNALPQWRTPDQAPTADSRNLVSSGGVFTAIKEAQLGTFHLWSEYPNVTYYATTLADLAAQATAPEADEIALVANSADGVNAIYGYDGTDWQFVEAYPDLEDFATTHVAKGTWADDEMYYFHNPETSVGTWNLLDANFGAAEAAIQAMQAQLAKSVLSADNTEYLLTTRATLADAQAVSPTAGKTTIVLITGV